MNPIFLRAEWRSLVLLNYRIDPSVLVPLLPAGLELDFHEGETFVSLVGFRFLQTRVFGLPFPGHGNFDEVNLRFYVRRRAPEGGWRRGVVFVRELVPRWAIAFVARTFYGEPYLALPMRHKIAQTATSHEAEYGWRREGHWEWLRARCESAPQPLEIGSLEEFILEHYWGYTARRGGCSEYQLEHPRWQISRAVESGFQADVGRLYGPAFVETLAEKPVSAFIAEGSAVTVRRNTALG